MADFVSGLSRLKLLRAGDIMRALPAAATNGIAVDWPRAGIDSDLDRLVDLAAESEHPIVVVSLEGTPVGLVDKRALLRGIQGRAPDG